MDAVSGDRLYVSHHETVGRVRERGVVLSRRTIQTERGVAGNGSVQAGDGGGETSVVDQLVVWKRGRGGRRQWEAVGDGRRW